LVAGFTGPSVQGAVNVITGEGLPYSGFSSLSRESDRVLQQFYDSTFFSSIAMPMQVTAMSFRLPAIADVDYPALGDLNFGPPGVMSVWKLTQPAALSSPDWRSLP